MRAFRFEVRLDRAIESGADWQELAAQYERPPEEWEWYRPVQGPSYALLSDSALARRQLEVTKALSLLERRRLDAYLEHNAYNRRIGYRRLPDGSKVEAPRIEPFVTPEGTIVIP